MSRINLNGQVAIVTGAGSGLGRSHAIALADYGATVAVNDIDRLGRADAPAPNSTVDEIRGRGGKASWLPGDVADFAGACAMIDAVVEEHGRIDILVNNAGVNQAAPMETTDMALFQRLVQVHLMGSAHMTRAVWPVMQRQEYGRIVMTTSSCVFGSPQQTAYTAAKMGVLGLMVSLAGEGGPQGIRVNAIAPCARTPDLEGAFEDYFLEAMDPRQPSEAVVFLSSEDAPQRCILYAGGGGFSTLHLLDSGGVFLGPQADATLVRDHLADIRDMSEPREYTLVIDHLAKFNDQIGIPRNILRFGTGERFDAGT